MVFTSNGVKAPFCAELIKYMPEHEVAAPPEMVLPTAYPHTFARRVSAAYRYTSTPPAFASYRETADTDFNSILNAITNT